MRAVVVASEKMSTDKGIAQKTGTLMMQYHIDPNDVFIDNF